jgi:hypothetical protein
MFYALYNFSSKSSGFRARHKRANSTELLCSACSDSSYFSITLWRISRKTDMNRFSLATLLDSKTTQAYVTAGTIFCYSVRMSSFVVVHVGGSHKWMYINGRQCDYSGKAQKQFNGKLQTLFLVREDALKAERRKCQTKEEQAKIWSRVPKGGPIPRRTGRLTVGRRRTPTPSYPP